jgi:hypothetical protein
LRFDRSEFRRKISVKEGFGGISLGEYESRHGKTGGI